MASEVNRLESNELNLNLSYHSKGVDFVSGAAVEKEYEYVLLFILYFDPI
jgi:hypothetical protein